MKGIAILAIILSGFYVFALSLVSSQLKDMANFYSNLDQISSQVANGQSPDLPFKAQNVKSVIDSLPSLTQPDH